MFKGGKNVIACSITSNIVISLAREHSPLGQGSLFLWLVSSLTKLDMMKEEIVVYLNVA